MAKYSDTYRQEAEEHLADIEETVLDIEQNPEDKEGINRLFRAFHTIKGSGAMFGFDDIADFTHHIENALDKVRRGTLAVCRELIDLILASRDQIKIMLEAEEGGPPAEPGLSADIIAALEKLMSVPEVSSESLNLSVLSRGNREMTYRIRFRPHPNMFSFGMDPSLVLKELRELGECDAIGHTHSIPRLENLNPESCYIHWSIILTTDKGINAIRDVFIFIEDNCELKIELLDDHSEEDSRVHKRIGEILIERGDISCEELKKALESQKRVGEILVASEKVDRDTIDSALAEQQHVRQIMAKRQQVTSASSVRVGSDKLDKLINLVGEMVVTQARLSQVAAMLDRTELAGPAEEVERLTVELRDCALNMRMFPIGAMFGKFRRLVRDLSAELCKEIELVTEGAETELDKTVIERLNDPLMHLIRNSIDHGIQTPGEREEQGKPRTGTVRLIAAYRGTSVIIKVTDDGMGLDADIIRKKAMEKGLISESAELSEKEIFSLIFAPGFSTAEQVTDISGRGVGLDVVKREIDALGGSVQISSERGKGTSVTLIMPLTLAIIEGLLIKAGTDDFVLPLALIEECAELTDEHVRKAHRRNVISLRGKPVPFVRLRELFDIPGTRPPIEQMVIAEVDAFRVGIVTDEIVGGIQTVIKPLDRLYRSAEGISGATIMGNGTVALILDIPELVRCATRDEGEGFGVRGLSHRTSDPEPRTRKG